MAYFDDAKRLLAHSQECLERIKSQNQYAVASGEIPSSLLIDIKHLLEDLRSALDYSAHGLVEKYGSVQNQRTIQFPYAPIANDRNWFEHEFQRRLPGVAASRPDIIDKLGSYQHFANRFGNMVFWLPAFMELTNANKHRQLTKHEIRIMKWIDYTVEIPAGSVDFQIPFPPSQDGSGQLSSRDENTLVFTADKTPVMFLIENATNNINRIVDELSII